MLLDATWLLMENEIQESRQGCSLEKQSSPAPIEAYVCWCYRANRRQDPYLPFHYCPQLQHQPPGNMTAIPVSVSESSRKPSWRLLWRMYGLGYCHSLDCGFYNRKKITLRDSQRTQWLWIMHKLSTSSRQVIEKIGINPCVRVNTCKMRISNAFCGWMQV